MQGARRVGADLGGWSKLVAAEPVEAQRRIVWIGGVEVGIRERTLLARMAAGTVLSVDLATLRDGALEVFCIERNLEVARRAQFPRLPQIRRAGCQEEG